VPEARTTVFAERALVARADETLAPAKVETYYPFGTDRGARIVSRLVLVPRNQSSEAHAHAHKIQPRNRVVTSRDVSSHRLASRADSLARIHPIDRSIDRASVGGSHIG